MPQIDFSRALSAPKDAPPPSAGTGPRHPEFTPGALPQEKPTKPFGAGRLPRAHFINIIFALVTFVGGLLCTFYLFNGAELWRAAATWPRKLLYPRPAAMTATVERDENRESTPASGQASIMAADHSGDPFSRSSGFLSLTLPSTVSASGVAAGLPSTALLRILRSPFAQLGFPVPGGDALTQAFNRAVSDLAQASHVEPQTPQAAPAAGAAQNQANASGNFPNNDAQQTITSTHSAFPPPTSEIGSAANHAPANPGGRH